MIINEPKRNVVGGEGEHIRVCFGGDEKILTRVDTDQCDIVVKIDQIPGIVCNFSRLRSYSLEVHVSGLPHTDETMLYSKARDNIWVGPGRCQGTKIELYHLRSVQSLTCLLVLL